MTVNSEILKWARETAGYDLTEAAHRIDLADAHGLTAENRLSKIEQGEVDPSPALLRRMAKQYRRPILTFYLPKIPRESDVGQDFRTLPARNDPNNALLNALLRDIKARQALTRELLEDDEDFKPLDFIGSVTPAMNVEEVARIIARDIGFDKSAFRASDSVEAAFALLRSNAESLGIFVILAGNLGSWQTAIDVEIFRGFALADNLAPFIVINDQDAKSAWSFTLLHELAHIWLGLSGISGAVSPAGVERFCNDVAAAILVDSAEILNISASDDLSLEATDILIEEFASSRKISLSMVAYQLFRHRRISEYRWVQLRDRFRAKWIESRERQRDANRSRAGGPSYYIIRRHRIGNSLLELTQRGISDGSLTPARAAKILGVKPMSVYPILSIDNSRAGRAA